MSLPVLEYEHYTYVAGGRAFLNHLQSFATAQGWTTKAFLKDVQWSLADTGLYAFQPGDEDYIQLESDGYGAQHLGYEFRRVPYDTTSDQIEWAMYDTTYRSADYSNASHPIEQGDTTRNNYPTNGTAAQNAMMHWFSFPPTAYPDLWLFGNDKYILAVSRVTTNCFICVSFGTLVLPLECWERTDLCFFWPVQREGDANKATIRWDTMEGNSYENLKYFLPPFTYPRGAATGTTDGNVAWFQNAWKKAEMLSATTYTETTNFVPYYQESTGWSTYGKFNYTQYGIGYNDWAEVYVPQASTHFIAEGAVFYPVGVTPIAWIPWRSALLPGQELVFGNETFLAFPLFTTNSDFGFVVRVE